MDYVNMKPDQLSEYYTILLDVLNEKSTSENKIDKLCMILSYINTNYDKFDQEDLLDVRNMCLAAKHILIKIDGYKSLKLKKKEPCKMLLYAIDEKIKSSK